MADTQQVERLKRSIPEWNQWRKEHPEVQPDLSRADLSFANLRRANLSRTNLSFANLRRANLSRADLSRADLSRADLSGADLLRADLSHAYLLRADLLCANLSNADLSSATLSSAILSSAILSNADLSNATLSSATLSNANLSSANLSSANLSSANLSSADLSNADLSSANLGFTVFAENDLSTTKGLVEIDHQGPSIIQLHTVKLPPDGSALHFLRGTGTPDEWIDDYRAHMMHPIQYHSLFLSYSSQDETLARRLHADLQDHGVRCWFAPHNLRPGQLIRKGIDEAIHMQDKLLLILSKHSVKSGWVGYEVETALSREMRQKREILFPIRIDEAIFHCTANWTTSLINQRHIGDFTEWTDHDRYQKVFQRLLHHLKAQA